MREQRLGLVGRANLDVLADGQVIDRREEKRVTHDAGDRMDDQLVRAGAVDDAGTTGVDVARRRGAVATAAATRGGGDGLGGHLVGTLGGGLVTTAAAAGVLGGGLRRSGLLGARLLTLAATATTAATVLGGNGVGVDQLEHLTVSHVFSLSFGPQGNFGNPHPV